MSHTPVKPMGFIQDERLSFEYPPSDRQGVSLRQAPVPLPPVEQSLPGVPLREDNLEGLPRLSEFDAVRHFTRLSRANYSVDQGMYPLGSCTMKYNPRLNEWAAALVGFNQIHPLMNEPLTQGTLALMHQLQEWLSEITGFPGVSLQPAAGAHGELAGVLMIRAALEARGEQRPVILVPDSAHGTNPASAALAGFQVKEVKSGPDGCIDMADLTAKMDRQTAGLMLTNPNTLGIFEKNITEIAKVVHQHGGYVYCDGANMNAQVGVARPADYGMDVLHLNLHKTFSTPHGGGGPGAGPVHCTAELAPFLPGPVVEKSGPNYRMKDLGATSIGRLHAFHGNVGVLVRAWSYLLAMGGPGLREMTDTAVLNANYLRKELEGVLTPAHPTPTLHEVVFTDAGLAERNITTLDLAKRLIDHGFHPPTVYFPLTVKGAFMVEPTESEPREELDRFVMAVKAVLAEAETDPDTVHSAPHTAPRRRLDETRAARQPVLRWKKD
ncbi:MAG: aminomethyl-transferring glycine dehydrogenase subunit GcvPB [Deltaproteobacteria bacterium]|nr:aminomethyl-transferring glycine dehydrogenase subunit GcvPB [Deltaproteobacteria bacterium]